MKEISAGGVVVKREGSDKYILLVEYENNTFGFPKGHLKEGETPEEAAKREITEEVGLSGIVIGKKIGVISRKTINMNNGASDKDIIMFDVTINDYTHNEITEESFKWFKFNEAEFSFKYKEDKEFFIEKVLTI